MRNPEESDSTGASNRKSLDGALLGYPYSLPSLYPATYATALAPKGYTLDGLTYIISVETFQTHWAY